MVVLSQNITFGLAPAKKRVFPVLHKIHTFSVFLFVIAHKTILDWGYRCLSETVGAGTAVSAFPQGNQHHIYIYNIL